MVQWDAYLPAFCPYLPAMGVCLVRGGGCLPLVPGLGVWCLPRGSVCLGTESYDTYKNIMHLPQLAGMLPVHTNWDLQHQCSCLLLVLTQIFNAGNTHRPPPRWSKMHWQTGVKTLPSQTSFAGGNELPSMRGHYYTPTGSRQITCGAIFRMRDLNWFTFTAGHQQEQFLLRFDRSPSI